MRGAHDLGEAGDEIGGRSGKRAWRALIHE
jgi:hypothetical protein